MTTTETSKRPDCITHWKDIQGEDNKTYPASSERHAISSRFGTHWGFKRIGVNHQILRPGRRTSYPHAESAEEEMVYVIEGEPDAWIDGYLHKLKPGDAVGFVPGTGLCHTIINNTDTDVRLLVVGEHDREDNKIIYPLNPIRKEQIGAEWWDDAPSREMGPHNGLPDNPQP